MGHNISFYSHWPYHPFCCCWLNNPSSSMLQNIHPRSINIFMAFLIFPTRIHLLSAYYMLLSLHPYYYIFVMNFLLWNTMIDIGFWSRLTKKKIEEYKLDAQVKPLHAKYSLANKSEKLNILSIDAYSFGDTPEAEASGPVEYHVEGTFINFNTVEEFDSTDMGKQEELLLAEQQERIGKLVSGEDINSLPLFKLLIFGDFKKHVFKYQFLSTAIPVQDYQLVSQASAASVLTAEQLTKLNSIVFKFTNESKKAPPQLVVLRDFQPTSLKEFISNPEGNYLFLVTDMTTFEKHTGYHTSTVLAVFAYLREQKLVSDQHLKKVNILLMKEFLIYGLEKEYPFKISEHVVLDLSTITRAPLQNKISHKKKAAELDLKSFMDDRSIAKEAVDLNIKLMKWRLLPSLDIDKIQSKKCLLFGAGTLGCQLARNLIGWGIKNITFIDYSKVSYSNPVRQTLYDFEDTVGGGKPKAETAAEKLQKIYPEINSKGYSLKVPMPGHFVTKKEHLEETFETLNLLEKLVQEHDVLFLLLDSREARWLPTVLANKYDKACITVGLGFDSFVIVRHGVSPKVFNPEIHHERICCYFCNDIITPQNTMKDRTLDQQCTVTRPGLSFLSSSYASELYISMIHHPLEHRVGANEDPDKLATTDLGKLPHHIRGNMSDFETHLFYGRAFDKCVACSEYILDEYNNDRENFMVKVLNDPSFIHEVVQLKDQLEEFEKMDYNIIEIMDDEDFMTQQISQKEPETKAEEPETKAEEKVEKSEEKSGEKEEGESGNK